MISNSKSVFPILVFDNDHGWDALLDLAKPELDQRGLDRLKAVLEGRCQCVVVERHYIDKDYRDTFSNFHSKRFITPSSRCVRLHFFGEPVTEDQIIAVSDRNSTPYLGYAVVRPTKPNCIGRTLLSHSVRVSPKAHLSTCREEIHLMGTLLEASGFPFISQDADATVCAESALWMVLRYYSNRYSWYSEILPFQITNLASHHALGARIYPSGGLYSWQLAEALRLQRFSPIIYSRKQFPKDFEHLLYTYIESGLPLIVTLPEHAVVAYGHASDYTAAAPPPGSGFTYSSHFNRAFVINDDNQFPYQMLNEHGPANTRDSQYKWAEIEEFIVPLPEKVFLTAEQVRTAMEAVLSHSSIGIASEQAFNNRPLVFRLYLTSARSFKKGLRRRGMGNPVVEKIYRQLPMPHFIWICEIADYSEYGASKKVLGEIIWDATRNAHEPDGWMALHFPGRLIVDVGAAFNHPQSLKTFPLTGSISYLLYESNLHSL